MVATPNCTIDTVFWCCCCCDCQLFVLFACFVLTEKCICRLSCLDLGTLSIFPAYLSKPHAIVSMPLPICNPGHWPIGPLNVHVHVLMHTIWIQSNTGSRSLINDTCPWLIHTPIFTIFDRNSVNPYIRIASVFSEESKNLFLVRMFYVSLLCFHLSNEQILRQIYSNHACL